MPRGPGDSDSSSRDEQDLQWEMARREAIYGLASGEAQLVWSRYSSMLTANAIVAGIVVALAARSPFTQKSAIAMLGASLLGLVLAWLWLTITRDGWELGYRWVQDAEALDWGDESNPMATYYDWCEVRGTGKGISDRLGRSACQVIYVFFLVYGLAGILCVLWLIGCLA